MMGYMGPGLGMGLWGWLWMLLFWGALIALAIWLIGLVFPSAKKRNDQQNDSLSAQEILNIRYARGEITDEQYRSMSHNINTIGP
ncbi:MAG: SHOCT domain-containing protein [Anaerolineae bacterium]|nr:SHOCT domain-containing protein [Anaerolineae bacterium]